MKAADMGVRVETGMRWLIVGHGSVGSALARRASTAGVLTELGFHIDAAGAECSDAALLKLARSHEKPRGTRVVPAARLKGLLADAAARLVKNEQVRVELGRGPTTVDLLGLTRLIGKGAFQQ
jgi:hypothetical protein